MADQLVLKGYRDVGYEYVNIDDCWPSKERDSTGALVADTQCFPSGIKALADYVHARSLKLGIYTDFGLYTCGRYPGSKFYLQKYAEMFASWGVDMLNMDGCYTDVGDMTFGYPTMFFFLNMTGHPMFYSCSWPAYDNSLIIGNYGWSYNQQQVQMALWTTMASPLLMSNDLSAVPAESKALLQNKRAIAINQDTLGVQGKLLIKVGQIELWTRRLSPNGNRVAFVFLNLASGGAPSQVSCPMTTIIPTTSNGYNVTEVFSGMFIGSLKPQDLLNITVNPSGVFFGLAVPLL